MTKEQKQKEFGYLTKAFKEERTVADYKNQPNYDKYSEQHLDKSIFINAYINEERKKVSLQFCGWEIVLLEDGTYFMNDTNGG